MEIIKVLHYPESKMTSTWIEGRLYAESTAPANVFVVEGLENKDKSITFRNVDENLEFFLDNCVYTEVGDTTHIEAWPWEIKYIDRIEKSEGKPNRKLKVTEVQEVKYAREDLIQICLDGIVPFKDWMNRDSYSAQCSLASVYEGLMVNVPYTTKTERNTIWITFHDLNDGHIEMMKKHNLDIDSLEDYLEEYGHDSEMFDGEGIDWHSEHIGTYMPTRERLNEGGDWY